MPPRVAGCFFRNFQMPELPEVETMRRGIGPVVGCRIVALHTPRNSLKPIRLAPRLGAFRARLLGQVVTEIGRLGKRVLVHTAGGETMVFEPRMTGLVLLADPPDGAHVRLELQLSGGDVSRLLYWDRRGLGSVVLLRTDELLQHFPPDRVGPDALTISARDLQTRLGTSRRAIKVALMDQRALAGVGNLYASEILHFAKVSPAQMCHRLDTADWRRVHRSLRQVLRAAIRYEGSTLNDGTYRNALNQQGSYQAHHLVYARAGAECLTCGSGRIVRMVQAQRSTFYCPVCQPR